MCHIGFEKSYLDIAEAIAEFKKLHKVLFLFRGFFFRLQNLTRQGRSTNYVWRFYKKNVIWNLPYLRNGINTTPLENIKLQKERIQLEAIPFKTVIERLEASTDKIRQKMCSLKTIMQIKY